MIFISLPVFIITGILSYGSFYLDQKGDLLGSIHHLSGNLDVEINVKGRVVEHVRFYGNRMAFSIRADSINIKDIDTGLERTITTGEVFPVMIKSDSPGLLIRDDFISLRCQTRKNQDYYYLYGFESGVEVIKSGSVMGILFDLRSRAYNCLKCLFYQNLEYTAASFCEAVILGNTANLPERISKDFKRSGIYHLLAISGLHISFFVMIISVFINPLFSGKLHRTGSNKKAGFAGIFFILGLLLFYNFLVGGKASTIRATMMSVYFLLAAQVGREIDRKTVLSFVFIVMLVISPGFFLAPGFWLTFTAVFAISYANKPFMEISALLKKKFIQTRRPYNYTDGEKLKIAGDNYFFSIFITTFSVNIFIIPLLLYIFKETSLISLFTNLCAVPVFYVLLFILILSSISALIWPPAGAVIIPPSALLIGWLQEIAGSWRFFKLSFLKYRDFGALHLIIYYIFLLSVLIIISRVTKNYKRKRT